MQCLHVPKRKKPMKEHIVNESLSYMLETAHDPNERGDVLHEKCGIEQEEERQFRQREPHNLGTE